jgi:hypothetical protein
MCCACDARGRDKQFNTLVPKYERKRPIGGMTILKWTSKKGSIRIWTGFICLWIWSIGGTLCTDKLTFHFRKKRRIWLAKLILHSESGLRFVQSVCELQKWLPMCHLNIWSMFSSCVLNASEKAYGICLYMPHVIQHCKTSIRVL